MGYTHYWSHGDLPQRKWDEFERDVARIVGSAFAYTKVRIVEEFDRPGSPPIVTSDVVHFNGAGSDGYETFRFVRSSEDSFCKTDRKPYDKVVCAVLIAAKHHFGSTVMIGSDGSWADWKPGAQLYGIATSRVARNPLQPRGR